MQKYEKNAKKQRSPRQIPPPTEPASDEDLISAIADGNTWAMESLYQRYGRLLYSLVYRMVSDHHVTEDLLQEAFVSVWQHAVSYSPQAGAVRSWLVSIAHNRTIDYLRHIRRRANIKETTWEDAERDDASAIALPDVWDEAWRSVQSAQVRAALMEISTEQRMMIELAYFQGWTHTEISEGCRLPLGTVKARIRLGLMHLKRVLARMGVDEP